MKKLICLILGAALYLSLPAWSGPEKDKSEKPDYAALSQKAQTIADTLVSNYGSTSVQYALIDSGKIILSGSSGVYDKTSKRAITKNDMYGIGSTSKMFVTVAAMMLVDQGLLDIDKPLTEYIPEFKMADERYKQITPRMLMNHSSGLFGTSPDYTSLFGDVDETAHDTLLNRLAVQNLRAAPGEMSEYCNDGFSLLEILVERVSGRDFTAFLADNILKPLSLNNTKTPQNDFDRSRLAKLYMPPFDKALPVDTVNANGAGGIYSTAEDICRFAEVLMGNKPEILSAKSALQMQSEEYKNGVWPDDHDENIEGYGLGWDSVHAYPFRDYGIDVAMKTGDTELYHSVITTVPAYDISMAVVASGGNSNHNYCFTATVLQELLLEKGIIRGISPLKALKAPAKAVMPEALTALSGIYANSTYQSDVTVRDGILTVASVDGKTEYLYTGDNTFTSEDGSKKARFVEPGDGRTCLQITKIVTYPGVGQYVKCFFDCQKIEPVSVSQAVSDAWSRRAGKEYYMVSEKSTSEYYCFFQRMVMLGDFSNGYACGGAKIVDKNRALNTVNFRETSDLVFFTQEDVEYLRACDWVYVREDFIPEMTADTAECVLGMDGYSRYYSIGKSAAGKTMAVELPKDAAYAVYDENDVCVDFTTVTHNTKTVLPANGKVVFIGKKGDVFGIVLQKSRRR